MANALPDYMLLFFSTVFPDKDIIYLQCPHRIAGRIPSLIRIWFFNQSHLAAAILEAGMRAIASVSSLRLPKTVGMGKTCIRPRWLPSLGMMGITPCLSDPS